MENLGIFITFIILAIGLCKGQGVSKDLYRCRQMCYTKFMEDWHRCMDYEDCKNMCIPPPNINNYIPEAFSFLCWNSCDETLGPFLLSVTSTSKQGSLILVDIAWDQAIASTSKQCLVTWEVSGGGLMGNLLTDSPSVELSLWADTVYHIQVTCRNKETSKMRRSYKLLVDTKTINTGSSSLSSISAPSSSPSAIPVISLGANTKKFDHLFPMESLSASDTADRLRILKDSSKDRVSTTTKIQANEEYLNHIPSVIRSKLTTSNIDPSEIYLRNMFYVMIGLVGLLLGVFFVYFSTRSSRDKLATDKEELIHSEVCPDTRTLHV